jgi:hypothetical protein
MLTPDRREIFIGLTSELCVAFIVVAIIGWLIELPAKQLHKLLREEIESLNFNFNYFLINMECFIEESVEITEDGNIVNDNSFTDFVKKSNTTFSKLSKEVLINKVINADKVQFENFKIGIEESILKINTIRNAYSRILKYEQLATLIKLGRHMEWVKNSLTVILLTQGNPAIAKNWSANGIYSIIKELNSISS